MKYSINHRLQTTRVLKYSAIALLWFGAIELSLRLVYPLLPRPIANELASGYHTEGNGIYDYDENMHSYRMKANFKRSMYFNGHRWQHETNWQGFRNPKGRRKADIVLLGDSMVYGHGVEESETIRHQLENISGRSVSNLGIQGGSIHQYYQFIRNGFVTELDPSFVFLFFLTNDIKDLTVYLTDEQMRSFIDQKNNIEDIDYFSIPTAQTRTGLKNWLRGYSYTYRAIRIVRQLLSESMSTWLPHAQAEENWESFELFNRYPRRHLAMEFHLDALEKINRILKQRNIQLIHVFINTGARQYNDQEPIYKKILQSFCDINAIPSTSIGLTQTVHHVQANRQSLFLKRDGHFSGTGTRITAQVLYDGFLSKLDGAE